MIRKKSNGAYAARVGDGPERTFLRRHQAEEYEAEQKMSRRRARAGMEVEQGAITYGALCDLFLANYTAKTKPWTELMLSHSRRKFGTTLVRQLRPEGIGAWLHGLNYSEKTKSHILERMRTVLNMGVEWGYLSKSPARRGAVRSPGTGRVEAIQPFETWAQVRAVAAECGKYERMVLFACATGVRIPSELYRLTWGHIIPATAINVPGSKTRAAARQIPLTPYAMEALKGLPQGLPHVLLFQESEYQTFRKTVWPRALDRVGLSRRPPYQMRHTFATIALTKGVPIDAVSKAMGHASIEITMRYYAKYLPTTLAELFLRMDDQEGEAHEEGTADSSGHR